MNGRGLGPVTALLILVLVSAIGPSRSPAQELPPRTVPGYRYGPWSVYQTPMGPVTGYRYGAWSVYQTPAGTVQGYQHGPWSVYQTPAGPVQGSQHGPWSVYQTPGGTVQGYQHGRWSVHQLPAQAMGGNPTFSGPTQAAYPGVPLGVQYGPVYGPRPPGAVAGRAR